MNIRNVSIQDYNLIKKYYHFSIFKSMRMKLSILVILLCLFYSVFYSVFYGFNPYSLIIDIIALFGAVSLLYRWFVQPKTIYNKNNSKLKDAKLEYIFTDEHLTIISGTDSYSGTAEMEYGVIIKAYETKEFFYLYVNARTAYAVDKKRFEEGTALDLRNLLLSKLPPKKYKIQR